MSDLFNETQQQSANDMNPVAAAIINSPALDNPLNELISAEVTKFVKEKIGPLMMQLTNDYLLDIFANTDAIQNVVKGILAEGPVIPGFQPCLECSQYKKKPGLLNQMLLEAEDEAPISTPVSTDDNQLTTPSKLTIFDSQENK